jgi:membrane associated rhomboid family serine protease
MAMAVPESVSAGGIAWEVHLGGFIVGLLTFGAFDPPPNVSS